MYMHNFASILLRVNDRFNCIECQRSFQDVDEDNVLCNSETFIQKRVFYQHHNKERARHSN